MNNFEECLSNANDYFEIACHVDSMRKEFSLKYLSVFSTNLTFACELYLKYLLIVNGEEVKSHKLNELYKKVNCVDDIIVKKIEKIYGSEYHIHSINELLRSDGNNFVDFRYLHERGDRKIIHTTDLSLFARTLNKVCNYEMEKINGKNYSG